MALGDLDEEPLSPLLAHRIRKEDDASDSTSIHRFPIFAIVFMCDNAPVHV